MQPDVNVRLHAAFTNIANLRILLLPMHVSAAAMR